MSGLTLAQCAAALDGKPGPADPADLLISSVSTDTRSLRAGDTFVALVGPRHDAHEHCRQAVEKGANALIVARRLELDIPQLLVDDTLIALGALARAWLSRHPVPLVAITGSNGKTTVKEMLRSILAELGPVLATRGNLNNEIGVPLTLLALQPQHRHAVVEMGASHGGEIAYLSKLASPRVALVNNVSSAHLEGFGSLDAVARAKSEIFLGLQAQGHAVINADDSYAAMLVEAAADYQCTRFGFAADADVRGELRDGVFTVCAGDREFQPALQLPGRHNQCNALAASAIALCLGLETATICAGLEKVQAVAGRLQRKYPAAGITLIDDSYNANPASASAAVRVLAEHSGERVLVLGDMLELGSDAEALHAGIGELSREQGVHKLYTVGPLAAHAAQAFGQGGESFADKRQLLEALLASDALAAGGSTILVKGSRGSGMEEVVEGLMSLQGRGGGREVRLS